MKPIDGNENPRITSDTSFYIGDNMTVKKENCFDCGDSFDPSELVFARYESVKICENCAEQRDQEDDEDE